MDKAELIEVLVDLYNTESQTAALKAGWACHPAESVSNIRNTQGAAMYVIVDTLQQHQYADKEEAQAALTAMEREFGPGYRLFSTASDKTPLQLELLYSLVLELLKTGKVNPVFIKMTMTNLLGEEVEMTALQIINDARAWIDAHVE